jgi:hypothetical protein
MPRPSLFPILEGRRRSLKSRIDCTTAILVTPPSPPLACPPTVQSLFFMLTLPILALAFSMLSLLKPGSTLSIPKNQCHPRRTGSLSLAYWICSFCPALLPSPCLSNTPHLRELARCLRTGRWDTISVDGITCHRVTSEACRGDLTRVICLWTSSGWTSSTPRSTSI